jgi:hypothetical protein
MVIKKNHLMLLFFLLNTFITTNAIVCFVTGKDCSLPPRIDKCWTTVATNVINTTELIKNIRKDFAIPPHKEIRLGNQKIIFEDDLMIVHVSFETYKPR